jgi:glutamate N-acetyltransferase/amino-acid N-acetyltransferase
MPLSYSQGFNPHPRIAIAAPLALGITSEAELMDVFLERKVAPHFFSRVVNEQLPQGINILEARECWPKLPSLQSQLRFAEYRVEVESRRTSEEIRQALRCLLTKKNLPWQHARDREIRQYDLRALIDALWIIDQGDACYTLGMRLRNDSSGSGRPEQVTAALGFADRPRSIHRTKLILASHNPPSSGGRELYGTVTSPRGFLAGAAFANIKASRERPFDLAILYSDAPCAAAAVFTTNKIKAAPVVLCRNRLQTGIAQAVVANSGCANACTGEEGLGDAEQMASIVARKLGLSAEAVMVASTGVIGTRLPMDRIKSGIERIVLSPDGGHDLAHAIMTTDTVTKEIAVSIPINGEQVIIGGVAKGAGMIHPDLATMLCFLTTDAAVDPDFLQTALQRAVDISFNMITVDADTSPNDTVLLLANGLAGNAVLNGDSPDADSFQSALDQVCVYLARCIAADGEGATRLIEVTVEGALSTRDARIAARTIAGSPLVKTAVHGADPNWGRVLAAAGRSGAEMVEARIDLYLDHLCLVRDGIALPFDNSEAIAILKQDEVRFRLCLNLGEGQATAWGCDLTEEYIAINGDYTT